VIDGDVETGSVMAGQSVGMVRREQSTAEILGELVEQAVAMLVARDLDPEEGGLGARRRAPNEGRARAGG